MCFGVILKNHDPEEREFSDAEDQIREVLIHQNYLSQKDIRICMGFDVVSLSENKHYGNILELHSALIAEYEES